MIHRLRLIRNIGQFESDGSGANIPLARVTVFYAENGRGKTTIAAILRSLATGDPIPIAERRRLAATHPPHAVVNCDGDPAPAMFQNGVWTRTLPSLAIFDDAFVDANVYSGLAVDAGHRQGLHGLILGARAVAQNQLLQRLVARIEEHNASLREKAALIPADARGTYTIEDFCALQQEPELEGMIEATTRSLEATRERDPVRTTALFDILSLPAIDTAAIDRILSQDLPTLEANAANMVQAHLNGLGHDGERWVSEGMKYVPQPSTEVPSADCPFCLQDLTNSPVINSYRTYFSAEYAELKRRVSQALAETNRTHGNDLAASFERAIRVAVERRQFWSRFCGVPDIALDTARIAGDWNVAREAITKALSEKQAAPLGAC